MDDYNAPDYSLSQWVMLEFWMDIVAEGGDFDKEFWST